MIGEIEKLNKVFYNFEENPYSGLFNTESVWVDDYFDNTIVLHVDDCIDMMNLYPIVEDIGYTNIEYIAMLGCTLRVNEWLGFLSKLANENQCTLFVTESGLMSL